MVGLVVNTTTRTTSAVNGFQQVSAEDGRALVEALEATLDGIPDHNIEDAAPAVLRDVEPTRP